MKQAQSLLGEFFNSYEQELIWLLCKAVQTDSFNDFEKDIEESLHEDEVKNLLKKAREINLQGFLWLVARQNDTPVRSYTKLIFPGYPEGQNFDPEIDTIVGLFLVADLDEGWQDFLSFLADNNI